MALGLGEETPRMFSLLWRHQKANRRTCSFRVGAATAVVLRANEGGEVGTSTVVDGQVREDPVDVIGWQRRQSLLKERVMRDGTHDVDAKEGGVDGCFGGPGWV